MGKAMPPKINQYLTLALVAIALITFAVMFGDQIYKAWLPAPCRVADKDTYVYVATAIATLVGGIVAVAFGQKPPQFWVTSSPRGIMVAIYSVTYFLFGVVAVISWISAPCTSVILKNLATTFFGLALP
jgi:hypothetical protein